MLINLNETEVNFVLYAVRETAARLEAKLTNEGKTSAPIDLIKQNTVRLTKSGQPAKKPGRKPGKKIQPEQQAA